MKKLILNEEVKTKYEGSMALDFAVDLVCSFYEDEILFLEDFDLYEFVVDSINDKFIYWDDQWELMQNYFYCSPHDCTLSKSFDLLLEDVLELVLLVEEDEDYV